MSAETTRPRVEELRLQVHGCVLHPDWFHVRAHQRVIHEGWDADLRLTVDGHVIQWRYEGFRLSEVVSRATLAIPESGLLYKSPVGHERSTSLRPGPRIEYQTSFEVERCEPPVFDHLCVETTLDARRQGLFATFTSGNRLEPSSIGLIRFESRANGLSIHTFHSFPTERSIVRTHSLFETHIPLETRR